MARDEVVCRTQISRAYCDRMFDALRTENKTVLDKLLNPAKKRADRRPVISNKEIDIIKQCIQYSASRGLSIDKSTLNTIVTVIATYGLTGFRTTLGTPREDVIRAWSVRNRDVTYCTAEKNMQRRSMRSVTVMSKVSKPRSKRYITSTLVLLKVVTASGT